jgi:hypothetical protein
MTFARIAQESGRVALDAVGPSPEGFLHPIPAKVIQSSVRLNPLNHGPNGC